MSRYTDHHWVHQNSEEAADIIEQQQARIDELAATVERLREAVYSERKSLMVRVDAEKILQSTPRQNLNAVKRDAWINGYQSTGRLYHGENTEYMSIVRLATQRYPDKE